MSKEEWLAWIRDFEEGEKRAKKRYDAFSEKLTTELTELVFEHQPDMRTKRDVLGERVRKIAGEYMEEVKERFESVNFDFYRKRPIKKIWTVPKPKTREESEKELIEELKDIPQEDHEEYSKYHWEDYEDDKQHEDFLYAVFNKMKKVLVEFYFEFIVKFDSDYLRTLDHSIYWMCAEEFLQEVYGLEG